uniref:V-type proton ATPase subunit E n=1 Tax=Acrobeloides nanus TaxID=290746 RepID=A0A914BZN2_9BILA
MPIHEEMPGLVLERLAPMIAYIDQESDEKVDEIQVRTDEEAKLEINKVVKQQTEKIAEFYARKFRQVDIQHKVHTSNTANHARIECLKERERLTNEVLDGARQDLSMISADKNRYPHILKGLIMQGLLQLLEKEVDIQHKVHTSNTANHARIECLKERERLTNEVLDGARQDLSMISADKNRYPHILKGLIMQGLLQLLEKEVILRCRKEDESLIENILQDILDEQEKICDFKTVVKIDNENFLGNNCSGGVELRTESGKIAVKSTLESRLELIAGQIMPQIRTALFGQNPNRAFFE